MDSLRYDKEAAPWMGDLGEEALYWYAEPFLDLVVN
jgi:hypothetical protein